METGVNAAAPPGQTAFLVGGGEMGARMRAFDWTSTPLGPVQQWPQSRRSALSILLPSKAQIALFWGSEFITLYNDAYRPALGAKHPWALGKPARECWSELWTVIEPLFTRVVGTDEAFWAQDHPFYLEHHGFAEETYFDVSYDPVRDESGKVGGLFCIVSETTGRVLGERRLSTLRELGAKTIEGYGAETVLQQAAEALSLNPADLPYAFLYLLDDRGHARCPPFFIILVRQDEVHRTRRGLPLCKRNRNAMLQPLCMRPMGKSALMHDPPRNPGKSTKAKAFPYASLNRHRACRKTLRLGPPFWPITGEHRASSEISRHAAEVAALEATPARQDTSDDRRRRAPTEGLMRALRDRG